VTVPAAVAATMALTTAMVAMPVAAVSAMTLVVEPTAEILPLARAAALVSDEEKTPHPTSP